MVTGERGKDEMPIGEKREADDQAKNSAATN